MNSFRHVILLSLSALVCVSAAPPYPIDGYEESGIRRIKRLERIVAGELPKEAQPIAGALKSIKDIKLNLSDTPWDKLKCIPEPEPAFQKAISGLFAGMNSNYSLTILELTPGKEMRYAGHRASSQYQPGSVGKLAVATGLFTELAKIYPGSFEERQELLRTRSVRGGRWAMTDSHTVPFYNPETQSFVKRTVQEADVFTLYEWLDHMLSVSNNGAASVCWREAILMRVFGADYPTLTEKQADEYWARTPKSELSDIANSVVNDPLREMDITPDEWRLGTLFTRGGGSYIPGKGGSTGTPIGLMKFMIAMEHGMIVDQETSLEIKRLMYMTDRRIRYASSPSLKDAAVYFKSGSLYKCRQEPGYSCGKYKGNVENFMNSVAIVEHPDGTTYMVVLMSNVLRKNSGSDHQALAGSIEKIIRGL
jgi:hypothetical protein